MFFSESGGRFKKIAFIFPQAWDIVVMFKV